MDVEHLRATPIGGVVDAEATLVKREGRVLEYAVTASDSTGIIGQGNHQRYIINLEKFMERLQRKKKALITPIIGTLGGSRKSRSRWLPDRVYRHNGLQGVMRRELRGISGEPVGGSCRIRPGR